MDFAAVAAVTILFIILLLWIGSTRRETFAKQRSKDALRRGTQYSFSDHVNTIFVVLPCGPGDGGLCAETLFSLFDQADAPWRLAVGVMQHVSPSTGSGLTAATAENAVVVYEQMCRQAGAECYANNVRLLLRPATEAAGPTVARAIVHQQLYRRERFCAAVECGTRMLPRWDTTALRLLEGCRRRSRHPILTTQPQTHDNQTAVLEGPQPTFAVIAAVDPNGFPVYGPGVPFAQPPLKCYRTALYTPALAFGASEDVRAAMPDPKLMYVGGSAAAFVEGLRLHTLGRDFYTPSQPICTVSKASVRWWQQLGEKQQQKARAEALVRARAVAHRDLCRVCGATRDEHTPAHHVGHPFAAAAPDVDAVFVEAGPGSTRTIESYTALSGFRLGTLPSRRARLGLLPDPAEDEVVSKFRDRQTLAALLETMRNG